VDAFHEGEWNFHHDREIEGFASTMLKCSLLGFAGIARRGKYYPLKNVFCGFGVAFPDVSIESGRVSNGMI
jgi:hypothetical protein